MELKLEPMQRGALRQLQRKEKDKRRYVKITILLMLDARYSPQQIGDALGIDDATVYRHVDRFQQLADADLEVYLQDNYVAYAGRLNREQLAKLDLTLQKRFFRSSQEIASYIKEAFQQSYTRSGLVPVLKNLGFVFKKTKQQSEKADAQAQAKFVEEFYALIAGLQSNDTVYFIDAVHPQHNTRPSYGWIKSGTDFLINATTGRNRVNINGAVNALDVTDIVIREDCTINAESTIALYEQLEARHRRGIIYVISDNARYYRNRMLQQWLSEHRIKQVFLPAYSPNLNIIERLWKFLRKTVIDTTYYPTLGAFQVAIVSFFENIHQYADELKSLLTLNFHIPGLSQTT